MATLSQSRDPVAPSILQIHILPEFESMVVKTTAVFELSNAPHEGSEGCVPRSKTTSQSKSVGVDVVSERETTVGSFVFSLTTAKTSSGPPSSFKSASNG